MTTLAKAYQDTWLAHIVAESTLEDALVKIFEVPENADWWTSFTCDPVDWDGWSVELQGAKPGLVPTEAQLEQIWALGFTVVRIDYADQPAHALSGDWWQVKGHPPMSCSHTRRDP